MFNISVVFFTILWLETFSKEKTQISRVTQFSCVTNYFILYFPYKKKHSIAEKLTQFKVTDIAHQPQK